MAKTKLHLLVVWGDCDPQMMGPFKTEETRDKKAIKIKEKYGDENGIYMLDITDSYPRIYSYSGGFFDSGVERFPTVRMG